MTEHKSEPAALTSNGIANLDEKLVAVGPINIRKTHPNLYHLIMLFGIGNIALGINFQIFVPTFKVYSQPNPLWGTIFILLGLSELAFLNVWRNLVAVRASMAASVAYTTFFALGTMQPALEGKGSLQLPILYLVLVVIKLALLFEPFINPWTARRD